ncbi:MAG: M20/M25/M40 family metallo-hydrolase [Alicyclobacillus sp.]|nr:M20/M25/M40 family metallo-hydrolase [Alicyclobacillus sp.]
MSRESLKEAISLPWLEKVKQALPDAVAMLQRYCRQPSVSAQNLGIAETVAMVREMVEGLGGECRVLNDCGGNPVIYACFEAGPSGHPDRTLLFYNHYDVQPPEPIEEWTVPPFGAEIVDGKLYARGAADNKGELVARLTAIALLQANGGLPCRVKFLIEGEEEIGSPALPRYLEKYADLFKADACIWEFGGKNQHEQVELVAGIKGMCYLQFWCHGADVDVHSSMGAVLDNAAWRLVHALATLKSADNRILVEGFYDDVVPPTPALRRIAEELPVEDLKSLYGLRRPLITGDENPNYALLFEPTMTICGIESGYTGEGSKTVLPKRAQAKVDCRLVPNQDPDDILRKVRRHLDRHGFTDVEVTQINGERAYRSNLDHPFVRMVVDTAREAYETEVVLHPNSAGTGPMYPFGEFLGLDLPIVSTGCGWWNSRAHAPDESIRLADFERGILHMVLLMERFGGR